MQRRITIKGISSTALFLVLAFSPTLLLHPSPSFNRMRATR